MGQLKIGTKVVIAIVGVVLICMIILSVIVDYKSHNILQTESEKLLMNTAKRSANAISTTLQGSYASLAVTHADLQSLIFDNLDNKEIIIEQELSNMADALHSNVFSFVYMKNSGLFKNSKYEFGDNEIMMVTYDSTPGVKGGVIVSGVNSEILSWQKVQEAISTGKPTITMPHYFTMNGNRFYVSTLIMPLVDNNGRVLGVLGVLVDLNVVKRDLMKPSRSVFDGDYRFLIDGNGVFILHPNEEYQGKPLASLNSDPSSQELLSIARSGGEGVLPYKNLEGRDSYTGITSFKIGNFSEIWSVVVTAPQESIFAPSVAIRAIIIGSAIIITAIIALVVFIQCHYHHCYHCFSGIHYCKK